MKEGAPKPQLQLQPEPKQVSAPKEKPVQGLPTSPEAIIKEAANLCCRNDTPPSVKKKLIDSLFDTLRSQQGINFKDLVINNLNFSNSSEYSRTSNFLELLRTLREMEYYEY